jgi:hypothetical protein
LQRFILGNFSTICKFIFQRREKKIGFWAFSQHMPIFFLKQFEIAKYIEVCLNIFYLQSQIWLNPLVDDRNFSYITQLKKIH